MNLVEFSSSSVLTDAAWRISTGTGRSSDGVWSKVDLREGPTASGRGAGRASTSDEWSRQLPASPFPRPWEAE